MLGTVGVPAAPGRVFVVQSFVLSWERAEGTMAMPRVEVCATQTPRSGTLTPSVPAVLLFPPWSCSW